MLVVEKLKHVLQQTPEVRLAVLFGSMSRRTARPGSDVDVAILLKSDSDPDGTRLNVELERELARSVHLVRLDTAPPLLRFEIARDGLLLIERETHAWSEFRAHAMIDWWDWAPTARMMHDTMAARLRQETKRGPS
jgi:predicted nucleotidyltransferase